jgi:hypothetical protein
MASPPNIASIGCDLNRNTRSKRPNLRVESEAREVLPKEKLVESFIGNIYPTVKRDHIIDGMVQISRI